MIKFVNRPPESTHSSHSNREERHSDLSICFNMKIMITQFLLFTFLLNCDQKKSEEAQRTSGTTQSSSVSKEFRTRTGKTFLVTEEKISTGLRHVLVASRDFTEENEPFDLETIDPISHIFLADSDTNGFDELYIITRSTGSGSYATIYGFSSNLDRSFSSVEVPEITDKERRKNQTFEGYMGHDSVYVENTYIIREFPVYRPGDPNAKPTGGRRAVLYSLEAGEASWNLLVRKFENRK